MLWCCWLGNSMWLLKSQTLPIFPKEIFVLWSIQPGLGSVQKSRTDSSHGIFFYYYILVM